MIKPFKIEPGTNTKNVIAIWNLYLSYSFEKSNDVEIKKEAFNMCVEALKPGTEHEHVYYLCQILEHIIGHADYSQTKNFAPEMLRKLWEHSDKTESSSVAIIGVADQFFNTDSEIAFICSEPYNPEILERVYKGNRLYVALTMLNALSEKEDVQYFNAHEKYLIKWCFKPEFVSELLHISPSMYQSTIQKITVSPESLFNNLDDALRLKTLVSTIHVFEQITTTDSWQTIEPVLNLSSINKYFESLYPAVTKEFKAITSICPDINTSELFTQLALNHYTIDSYSLPELK